MKSVWLSVLFVLKSWIAVTSRQTGSPTEETERILEEGNTGWQCMIKTNNTVLDVRGSFIKSASYRTRPNYRTVRWGFSQLLGKLVVKYVSTYTMGTLKKPAKDLLNDSYAMFVCVCVFLFWFSL